MITLRCNREKKELTVYRGEEGEKPYANVPVLNAKNIRPMSRLPHGTTYNIEYDYQNERYAIIIRHCTPDLISTLHNFCCYIAEGNISIKTNVKRKFNTIDTGCSIASSAVDDIKRRKTDRDEDKSTFSSCISGLDDAPSSRPSSSGIYVPSSFASSNKRAPLSLISNNHNNNVVVRNSTASASFSRPMSSATSAKSTMTIRNLHNPSPRTSMARLSNEFNHTSKLYADSPVNFSNKEIRDHSTPYTPARATTSLAVVEKSSMPIISAKPPNQPDFIDLSLSPDENGTAKSDLLRMPNVGNSCYMNAVLQVFFNLEFIDRLRSTFNGYAAHKNGVEDISPVVCSLLKVYDANAEERRDFLEKFSEIVYENSLLSRKSQEDAHEFLIFLFAQFEKEIKELKRFCRPINMTPRTSEDHLVESLFNHRICSVYRCDKCHELSEPKKECGNHLLLQLNDNMKLNGSRTITDLLLNELDEDDGIHMECTKCHGQMRKIRKYFDKYPRYIILTLIRYSYDAAEKCRRKISVPVIASRRINFLHTSACSTFAPNSQLTPLKTHKVSVARGDVNGTPKCTRLISDTSLFSPSGAVNKMSLMTDQAELEDAFMSEDEDTPSEKAINDIGDLEEISILKENVPSPKKKLHYTPVDHAWRARICKLLNLTDYLRDQRDSVYELERVCDERKITFTRSDAPKETAEIPGDGNCLFSSLSHVITGGSCDANEIIRKKICDFLSMNEKEFSCFVDELHDYSTYVRRMRNNSEWGSQAELLAFATLTQTPIYTYYNGNWTCYEPRFKRSDAGYELESLFDDEPQAEGKIYLSNTSLHYEPVISMKRTLSYEIRGIVNHLGQYTEAGHYLSFLRKREKRRMGLRQKFSSTGGQWLKCDDATVTEVTRDEALNECAKTGYIFFYECMESSD